MNIAKVHLEPRRLAAVMLMLIVSIVSTSYAQKFQELMGGSCEEQGYSGTPLARGGYVAVGITNTMSNGSCNSTYDVYVVKLNANGSFAWARSYNLGGYDIGRDIRECANGDLVVLAYTSNNPSGFGNGDIVILRLTSTGAVIWSDIYGTAGLNEAGNHIIETTLSAGGSTSAGDFVVCGYQSGSTSSTDGLLLRTKSTGGLIWMETYDGGSFDVLNGLDESTVGGGRSDIIAVGNSNSYGTCNQTQGLVLRVSGANGLIGGSPQGVSVFGRYDYVDLESVDELTIGNNAGNIVAAGSIPVGSNSDIYLLETTADPCTTVVDATYGDADSTTEVAFSIREIGGNGGTGLNTGNIIVSGVSKWFTEATGAQGFLLEVDPSLAIVTSPTGVGYRLYGPGVEKVLWGEPVYDITGVTTAGFYMIGYSFSYYPTWAGQVYLVKTDNLGYSYCYDTTVSPCHTRPAFRPNCVAMHQNSIGLFNKLKEADTARRGDTILCNDTLGITASSGSNGSTSGADLSLLGGGDRNLLMMAGLGSAPQPVRAGTTLTLGYRAERGSRVNVVVADGSGREVYHRAANAEEGQTNVQVSTAGWTPGSYVISSNVGEKTLVDRVVVDGR